jgi:hypothetical protein
MFNYIDTLVAMNLLYIFLDIVLVVDLYEIKECHNKSRG